MKIKLKKIMFITAMWMLSNFSILSLILFFPVESGDSTLYHMFAGIITITIFSIVYIIFILLYEK